MGTRVPTIYVLSKNKKNIKIAENFQFLKLKKSVYIGWASFRNVMDCNTLCGYWLCKVKQE